MSHVQHRRSDHYSRRDEPARRRNERRMSQQWRNGVLPGASYTEKSKLWQHRAKSRAAAWPGRARLTAFRAGTQARFVSELTETPSTAGLGVVAATRHWTWAPSMGHGYRDATPRFGGRGCGVSACGERILMPTEARLASLRMYQPRVAHRAWRHRWSSDGRARVHSHTSKQ
jgi:hypothetical protein